MQLSPEHFQQQQFNLHEAMPSLWAQYPAVAEGLVRQSHLPEPQRETFAQNPNDPAEHQPMWHQFGIITHSAKFAEHLVTTVPDYLQAWGIAEPVNEALAQEIDGVPKRDLLQVVAYAHDFGKFTAKQLKSTPDGTSWHFGGHEDHSAQLIRDGAVNDLLKAHNLTEAQIDYVARCAELHYKLGRVRDAARNAGGYTIGFTQTETFNATAQKIMRKYPDFALEIGLQFIADSLSKADVRAEAETDDQITGQAEAVHTVITEQGLSPSLAQGALQMPVNIKSAEAYLKLWAASQAQAA